MEVEDQRGPLGDLLPLLGKVPHFEGLPSEDLERIAGIVGRVEVGEGEWVFREGEAGDTLFVVESGAVELSVTRPTGDLEKLAVRRPGEAFGEMALLEDAPRSAGAKAREDSVLLRMRRAEFQSLLGENPLALRMLSSLSRALRALDLRLGAQERLSGRGSGVDVAEMSRLIQRALLPGGTPMVKGFDIAAGTNLEEAGAGATAWDHFQLRDGRAGLIVMNVLGEGLPPGHYLAIARSLFREIARDQTDVTGLLARVNSGLAAAVVEGMEQYVEAGVLLPTDGGVEWAGAGRCPGAVIRRNGVFEEFASHGPPLGMLEGFLYGTQRVDLGLGDTIIVLSQASPGIFRGAADLAASLQGKPVGEIVSMVHKALRKAQGGGVLETSVLFVRRQ